MKELAKKFAKVVLIAVSGAVAAVGYFVYDQKIDTKAVFIGDVSAVGQGLEDAASAP